MEKLLKYRTLAQSFTRVEVRSGASTSFWYDEWNQLGILLYLTGLRGCIDLGIPVNSTVEQVVQSHRRRRHRQEILNKIEEEIQKIKLQGLTQENDIRLWRGKSDFYRPGFSTKHTWHSVRTVAVKQQWSEAIWFTLATPKYSIHATRAQNRLATGDRLVQWYAQTVAYSVWRERNGRKHGETHQPASRLQHMIDKLIRNVISSIRAMGKKGMRQQCRYGLLVKQVDKDSHIILSCSILLDS
ncbi:hypothetical protein Bca52824_008954 [Brassica carinata]|uniref:Uncharacterized protein n=1 Tax=Brassica carinata TaxID=52824 RepID=A0A8X7WA29_BRACI|nr:hypothetical protein Bca52824_008954 [Brassica carinata]